MLVTTEKENAGTFENLCYWFMRIIRITLCIYTIKLFYTMYIQKIPFHTILNELYVYDYKKAWNTKVVSKEIRFYSTPILYLLVIAFDEGFQRFLQIIRRIFLILTILVYIPNTSPTIHILLVSYNHINYLLPAIYLGIVLISAIYYLHMGCAVDADHESNYCIIALKTILQDIISPWNVIVMTIRRSQNMIEIFIELKTIKNTTSYRKNALRYFKSNYGWYTCCECGRKFRKSKMDVDHIQPQSKHGSNSLFNLQLMCQHCNRSKKNSIKHTPKHAFNNTTRVVKSIKKAIK